jgi:hypothetical protein
MIKRIFLLSLSISLSIANMPYNKQTIFFSSVPKCGTHLTKKIINDLLDTDQLNSIKWIRGQHLIPKWNNYQDDPNLKKIVVIRDIRDMCVSASYWLVKNDWFNSYIDHSKFYNKTHEEQLDYFINLNHPIYSIKAFAQRAVQWMKSPNVFVVRFEDIVGEKGGGDRNLQIETYKSLVKFMGFTVADEKIEAVADSIFGVGRIFRKGLIGQWREEFSSHQIENFKKRHSEELILLGYEKDALWTR